jgi:ATP-dependent DNA ligase
LYLQLDEMEKSGLYVAEVKEDGIFATIHFGSDGAEFISRSGQIKETSLTRADVPGLEGYSLVGELGYGSQASLIEKEKLGMSADEHFVKIFRVLKYENESKIDDYTDMNEVNQRKVLNELWSNLSDHTRARFRLADRWDGDFVDHYKSIVDAGGEGLVLKVKDGTYKIGTRNPDWIKVKKTIFVDMVVMGVELSTAKTYVDRGFASYIHVGAYVNGTLKKLCRVGSMSNDMRREFGSNFNQYKGQVVEIHAFEQFVSGSLRHPSFVRLRPDKLSTECVFASKKPL